MADLSQMIRWNASFVRGLAQSVLERARTVRASLTGTPVGPAGETAPTAGKKTAKRATERALKTMTAPKRPSTKRKPSRRVSRRARSPKRPSV